MAAGAVMMKAGCIAGPALHHERGLSLRLETKGLVHLAPAKLMRQAMRPRNAPHRQAIRAQANSRDDYKAGSSPPGEIKRTVEKEVGVSSGKGAPRGDDAPVSSGSTHAAAAQKLNPEDPNSFAYRALHPPAGQLHADETVSSSSKHWQAATAAGVPNSADKLPENQSRIQANKVKEVSEAVRGTTSYAAVAENLRHEGPKPGPIRSEVLDRAAPKQQESRETRSDEPRSDERPFKEPRKEDKLNLESQPARKFNFKSLAAIVAILFVAFGFAPVWSPVVGRVLTPFFQLVGVAVAVKFFVTDFLRADKRKELYKKGEKLKDDIAGS